MIDKSGTFSDQISVHFGSPSQNVLKSDLKKCWICIPWLLMNVTNDSPYNVFSILYIDSSTSSFTQRYRGCSRWFHHLRAAPGHCVWLRLQNVSVPPPTPAGAPLLRQPSQPTPSRALPATPSPSTLPRSHDHLPALRPSMSRPPTTVIGREKRPERSPTSAAASEPAEPPPARVREPALECDIHGARKPARHQHSRC